MTQALVGIIGGSGLYQMDALQNAQEHVMNTPFGAHPLSTYRYAELRKTRLRYVTSDGKTIPFRNLHKTPT